MPVKDDVGKILVGIIFLLVGLGVGYLMYLRPEGLNPEWPLWMALFAPAVFAFAGLHIAAAALGYPRLAVAMLQVILLCLWGLIHWAAFFTTHVQCVETVSFVGIQLLQTLPSEDACRRGLQLFVAAVDLIVVVALIAFTRRRLHKTRSASPPT